MNSDMNEWWRLPVGEAMERLFACAEAKGVESVSVNVRTREVRFSMKKDVKADESSDSISMFQLMREKYVDLESAKKHFDSWADSMIKRPKAQHFVQFVGHELESLFRSGFLVPDEYITDEERAEAADVLRRVNVKADGNVDKCVLLLRIVRWEDERFWFDSEEYIGKYMRQHGEVLNSRDFRSFFDFMARCITAYAEQDRLELSKVGDELNECFRKAMADISMLEKHVAERVGQKSYRMLWQCIIYNRVSLVQKIIRNEPNRFVGGYNKKLVCNIVGMMIDEGVLALNKNQANDLIYDTNVKSYISNYADSGTDSCITKEERKWIESIIRENMPKE